MKKKKTKNKTKQKTKQNKKKKKKKKKKNQKKKNQKKNQKKKKKERKKQTENNNNKQKTKKKKKKKQQKKQQQQHKNNNNNKKQTKFWSRSDFLHGADYYIHLFQLSHQNRIFVDIIRHYKSWRKGNSSEIHAPGIYRSVKHQIARNKQNDEELELFK